MPNEKKPSLQEQMKEVAEHTRIGLTEGRPVAWHRILMSATICLTGLILIFGLTMTYVTDKQAETLQHQPVVGVVENTKLPEDTYYIYRVFLDASNTRHYIVSSMHGGVLVSVAAPEGTSEPADIIAAQKYDSGCYTLHVDGEGNWEFLTTVVYKRLLEKQNGMKAGTEQLMENQP